MIIEIEKAKPIVEDIIKLAEKHPRCVVVIQYVIEQMEKLGLFLFDIAPTSKADAEYFREFKEKFTIDEVETMTRHLVFARKDDWEKRFEIPTVHPFRNRVTMEGIGVGIDDLLFSIYKALTGKELKVVSPYIGVGSTAEYRTKEAIKALRKLFQRKR